MSANSLDDLREKEFEEFCYDLISFESYDRHEDPRLSGPTAAGKDGGRDILLEVRHPPHESRGEYQRRYNLRPLTFDHVGLTAYSCKTGEEWLNQTLKDAQQGGQRAIDVLRMSGRFVLLVNSVARLDETYKRDNVRRTPKEHLVTALWERMKRVDAGAPDPGELVEILDANDLASWIRARRPEGGALEKWMNRFKLRPVLHGLDEWQSLHFEERVDVPFADESVRALVLRAISTFAQEEPADASQRVGWLIGPPGVGKTRLVLEALKSAGDLSQRVRVALSGDEAVSQLVEVLERYPAPLIIVDDCPEDVAGELAKMFRVHARDRRRSQLLLVTPAGRSERSFTDISRRWVLEPLHTETSRRLVSSVLAEGQSVEPTAVEKVVRLAEGYPWFLALLTRETLEEGRPPDSMREAVSWALASRSEAQGQALVDLRRNRMRAMLATLLTRGVDWRQLTPRRQESVARAVGLARWDEVVALWNDCTRRGVLRRRLHFQYVTPQVLAREIVNSLFDPDGGDDPGGRRVRVHGGELLDAFFEELRRLGPREDIAAGLSSGVLEALHENASNWAALGASHLLGSALSLAAERRPADTARVLRQAVEGLPIDALQAHLEVRRPLVVALERLAGRRGAFEDAEVTLFRLALAENEAYANNASSVWAQLFLPELHMTHRSSEQRLALLRERLASEHAAERRVALLGVRAMLATSQARVAVEPLDGAWPRPTPEEARFLRCSAWSALLECLEDDDRAVATDALEIVQKELHPAMWAELGEVVLPALAERASHLGERERRVLGAELQRMRLDDAVIETPAFRALELALAPATFSQRLRQLVGTWTADLDGSGTVHDERLARDALADVPGLLAEFDWLFSTEAVRAGAFAYAVGRCDVDRLVLAALRARWLRAEGQSGARIFFPRYLSGHEAAGRWELVDAELGANEAHDRGPLLVAQVTVVTNATPRRLAWIDASLRSEGDHQELLRTLGHHGLWLRPTPDDQVRELFGVLLDRHGAEGAAAVLRISRDRVLGDSSRVVWFRGELLRALAQSADVPVSPAADHAWVLCAIALVDVGEIEPVADLTMRVLGRPSGTLREAWRVLHHAHSRDARTTWGALARAVDRRDATGGHLLLAFRFHQKTFSWPTDQVLTWVGGDERRARVAVQLVRIEAEELPPLYRALIVRFGAGGSVANEIMAMIESTHGVVSSLADHDRARLSAARRWIDDENAIVKTFAQRLVDTLSRSLELHDAEEDEERRRWGT